VARIIYAVAGEGFGHSTRSHLIGQRFIDCGHDVMFAGSGKSLVYLKQYFGQRVKEIFGLSFAYDKGYVNPVETLKRNLVKLPEARKKNKRLFKEYFKPFAPDLVISDFEPFSAWWAWRNGVPFLSVDHEHMPALCKLEHPAGNWFSRLTAEAVIRCYYIGAVRYIVLNFFRAPLRVDSAVLAPPVVRPAAEALEPYEGSHILVYSTTDTARNELLSLLQSFAGQEFYVYGFNESGRFGNCLLKERSTEGFLADLAACRGVIASAGFSLISECMHLKKRMLLLPLAGQYEQIINAHYIHKLGLGVSSEKLDEAVLSQFLDSLGELLPDDGEIIWPDNEKFFKILQDVLGGLKDPVNITTR
jgi:uncharacterized protein (TIGR00661 family)